MQLWSIIPAVTPEQQNIKHAIYLQSYLTFYVNYFNAMVLKTGKLYNTFVEIVTINQKFKILEQTKYS